MLAFHGVWSAYGFWLPNDPRGSWSTWVAAWELYRFGGRATKTDTRRSVARRSHNRIKRIGTKRRLKHEPVSFSGVQARSVALGIADAAQSAEYVVRALAVMRDHVHVVIDAHVRKPSQVIGHLKRGATVRLIADGVHPFDDGGGRIKRSCWADRAWKVYLDTATDVRRAVGYVNDNPVRDGLRRQNWSCVRAL